MSNKTEGVAICGGHIDTEKIRQTHQQIEKIVEAYGDVNHEVAMITNTIKENWVGKGSNEFQVQYDFLIRKIEDFGDSLKDIYDALVEAEATYAEQDDSVRRKFVQAQQ